MSDRQRIYYTRIDDCPYGNRMPQVDLHELAMTSALELADKEGSRSYPVKFPIDGPPIRIVRLADVLYLPSLLDTGQSVQIVRERLFPIETTFDDWASEFVKSQAQARGRMKFSDFVDSDHAGDVCILGNLFSRNFTHWHEELMKLTMMEQAGMDCVYVVSELPKFARELLDLLGIPAHRILEVRGPTRFRSALYATPVSYRNVADYPAVLMALRDRLLAIDVSDEPTASGKLWLDRGKQTRLGRSLVNEDEVYRLVERYEFQRLDMGALSVKAQIAIARNMSVLAGLHGSQFVHAQLMPRRSNVIECFTPLYLNPTYTDIYRVMRHRYSQVCSYNTPLFPDSHGGDVWVDCQQLDLAMQAACEDVLDKSPS